VERARNYVPAPAQPLTALPSAQPRWAASGRAPAQRPPFAPLPCAWSHSPPCACACASLSLLNSTPQKSPPPFPTSPRPLYLFCCLVLTKHGPVPPVGLPVPPCLTCRPAARWRPRHWPAAEAKRAGLLPGRQRHAPTGVRAAWGETYCCAPGSPSLWAPTPTGLQQLDSGMDNCCCARLG
jgi:hypothetical protein